MTCSRSDRFWNPLWFWRTMLVLYLGALAYACFAHSEMLPTIHDWPLPIPFDKFAHFCMFAPFPILMYASIDKVHPAIKILIALLVGVLLAGGTEIIQGLTPYRDKDIMDFAADLAGLGASAMILVFWALSYGKRQTR